jgi:hypothetical protein
MKKNNVQNKNGNQAKPEVNTKVIVSFPGEIRSDFSGYLGLWPQLLQDFGLRLRILKVIKVYYLVLLSLRLPRFFSSDLRYITAEKSTIAVFTARSISMS